MKNSGVRFSIRTKYTAIFVLFLVILIGSMWLFNQVFLERYYVNRKLDRLRDARGQLETMLLADEDSYNSEETSLQRTCEAANISALVIQDQGVFSTLVFSTVSSGSGAMRMMADWRSGLESDTAQIYETAENYQLRRSTDRVTQTDQLECVGVLVTETDGEKQSYYYLLTMAFASIQESVQLINRFLLLAGLAAVVLGAAAVSLISSRLTRPIRRLTELSQKMASLDFSARYEGHSHDEIQVLGENMNETAGRLESAIRALQAANTQLETDIAEKEKIDRQRRELLANISHELKTPIALIEGYSEGLRDGVSEDADARTEYCNIILDEAGKMNRLVRQILSLNELESGAVPVSREEFDLPDLMRACAATYGLQAREKKVTMAADLPDRLPVFTDGFLIEQVMANYLSNAFHHVSEGGTVRLACGKNADGTAWLSVFNTGDRIPEESLDELWDKFYKVDKARTRAYGGSGIGLSIVKASMDNLGGSCSVKNREDGVEFGAVFPAENDSAPKAGAGKSEAAGTAAG